MTTITMSDRDLDMIYDTPDRDIAKENRHAHAQYAITVMEPLAHVQENWDGYFGKAVNREAMLGAAFAIGFLKSQCRAPRPRISPDRVGGVHLSWKSGDQEFEVEAHGFVSLNYVYADDAKGEEVEGVVKSRHDLLGMYRFVQAAKRLFQDVAG